MYVQNLARELGEETTIHVGTDSSAARAISLRRGVTPRCKHIGIKKLFSQEVFASGRAVLHKVPSEENRLDLFTKGVSLQTLARLRPLLGLGLDEAGDEVP